MPYRCFTCGVLCRKSQNPDCKTAINNSSCTLEYVEVIHFIHPEGAGLIKSRGNLLNSENKEGRVERLEPLKLCCHSIREDARFTPIASAVTCMDCLEFISKLEE